MTYTSEGINTEEVSNNDLFARKLSSRIDLNSSYSAKANASKAVQQTVRHKVGRY